MEISKAIREQIRKYHYIDVPAIIAFILTIVGAVSISSQSFTENAPDAVYWPLSLLGTAYAVDLAISHSYVMAFITNWFILTLLIEIPYLIIFGIWKLFKLMKK